MSDVQVHELATKILLEQVAKVVRMPAKQVNVEQSVFELGMDSLMAVELQVAIESQFGVNIPAMAMNEEMSIIQLAGQIAKQLNGNGADGADGANGANGANGDSLEPDPERDIFSSLSSRHGEGLSSEELEILADDVAESQRATQ